MVVDLLTILRSPTMLIFFNRIFHYKPSSWGTPMTMETPMREDGNMIINHNQKSFSMMFFPWDQVLHGDMKTCTAQDLRQFLGPSCRKICRDPKDQADLQAWIIWNHLKSFWFVGIYGVGTSPLWNHILQFPQLNVWTVWTLQNGRRLMTWSFKTHLETSHFRPKHH